jgi:hypothetical protein
MTFTIKHTPFLPGLVESPIKPKEITISIGQIDQMYEGRGNCCRCGCGGNYYYLDHNSRKIINALKKMASGKYDVESIDDYIFEITIDEYYNKWGQLSRNKVQTIYIKK